MAQTFPRWLGTADDLPTGMFTVNTPSQRVALACPLCGTVFDLPPACGPDQAGLSLYAVRCGAKTCDWWDFAVFEACWEKRP